MTAVAAYIPQPGTIPARAIKLLRDASPDMRITSAVLAEMLGQPSDGIAAYMSAARRHGIVFAEPAPDLPGAPLLWRMARPGDPPFTGGTWKPKRRDADDLVPMRQRVLPAAASAPSLLERPSFMVPPVVECTPAHVHREPKTRPPKPPAEPGPAPALAWVAPPAAAPQDPQVDVAGTLELTSKELADLPPEIVKELSVDARERIAKNSTPQGPKDGKADSPASGQRETASQEVDAIVSLQLPLNDGDHLVAPNLYLRVQGRAASLVLRYTSPTKGRRREMGLGGADLSDESFLEEQIALARTKARDAFALILQGQDPLDARDAPTPMRCAVWSDGTLAIEKGGNTQTYTLEETRTLLRYLDLVLAGQGSE